VLGGRCAGIPPGEIAAQEIGRAGQGLGRAFSWICARSVPRDPRGGLA